jgi:OPA family glycerol-3-phosphate transporter-like MFS transporter
MAGLFGVVFANFLLGRRALLGNHPLIGIIIMLLTAIPTALLLNAKGMTLTAGVICLCLICLLMEAFNQVFSTMMPAKFAAFGKAATVSGIFNSLIYVGSAISTYAFGAVAERVGWHMTTVLWLVLAISSAAILVFSIKPWLRFMVRKPH